MPKSKPSTSSRRPSDAESIAATRQALAKLRAEHPKLTRDDREELVAEAHMKCLPRWDGLGSYEARVTAKAHLLAIDRARKTKRHAEAVEVSTVDRPQTIDGLRAAVLRECRARVLEAMGGDEEWFARFFEDSVSAKVAEHRAASKAAKGVLRSLRGAPAWVIARVDMKAMEQFAYLHGTPLRQVRQVGCFFRGDGRPFGGIMGTDTERATLAILDGAWPKKARVGMTAPEVIALEADAIRNS